MYIMEYLVYHLKPYGYNTAGSCQKSRGDHSITKNIEVAQSSSSEKEKKAATELDTSKTVMKDVQSNTVQRKTKSIEQKPPDTSVKQTVEKPVPVVSEGQNVETELSKINGIENAKLYKIANYLKQANVEDFKSKMPQQINTQKS